MVKRTSQLTVEEHGDVANGRVGASLGREPLARVGEDALHEQLSRIRKYVAQVREESGVEDIHQIRVATRRLRTMARLLEETPVFRRKRVHRLRKQLQPLAAHLGAVRDLDILLQHLEQHEQHEQHGRSTGEPGQSGEASEANGMHSPLHDEMLQRREKALERLRKTLRQPRMRRLLRHPKRTAKRLVVRKPSAQQVLVRHVAGSALWERYEAVLSFEVALAGAVAAQQLHPLRIACKQLRYALELFSQESDSDAQSLIATLKDVQDHLGDLQDSVFAVTLLTRLRTERPDDAELESFHAAQEKQRDALLQSFTPYWQRISGAPYRRKLAALIAAM